MITLNWKSGLEFISHTPTGHSVTLDGYPSEGGTSAGPTPVELLLTSAAACMAMDVISILEKKKQVVTGYRLEIDGVRSAPEGTFPRPFTSMEIRHFVEGKGIDPAAVARAIQLSDEKYCTVVSTLRTKPDITMTWDVQEA